MIRVKILLIKRLHLEKSYESMVVNVLRILRESLFTIFLSPIAVSDYFLSHAACPMIY